MIKFQLFDSEKSYQCHFAEISSFVVSISHYMRAYFNYQALTQGTDFQLPADAAYLNCNPLQGVDGVSGIYAKIGCMERETFTSTKLQLILYTDQQCSVLYNDGQTARKHASRGYELNGALVSSKVSFNPAFYSCLSCSPENIAYTFNKLNSNWYDDDYISEHGNKNGNNGGYQDDAVDDLYYSKSDDDNVNKNGGGDDDGYWKYNSYNADYNDDGNRRQLELSSSESNKGIIQVSLETCVCVALVLNNRHDTDFSYDILRLLHTFSSGVSGCILVGISRDPTTSLRKRLLRYRRMEHVPTSLQVRRLV